MNDLIQMDIFFFITSVAVFVFVIFMIVIGTYLVTIVRKIRAITSEVQKFVLYTTTEGKKSVESIAEKIEDIINQGGIIERIIATTLGTIIAKSFGSRGKIKRDAPKK
jgi:hypothetical protein